MRGARKDGLAGGGTPSSIAGRLLARFYLRFHISLILLWSFSAGFLVTKAMLWAGIHSMVWRYPLALLASYAAFFLGVRIWLAYVGAGPFGANRSSGSSLIDGGNGGFDLPSWRGGGASLHGGGGDFSGGGASGSFAADSGSIANASTGPVRAGSWFGWSGGGKSSGSSGSGGGGIDLDLGDGDSWLVILLLIVVAALLSSVLGVVIYLVYSAPAVLADVAFQAMLAGGLIRGTRRWRDASWQLSLFKATWIPFAVIFVLAVVTAVIAAQVFPDAHTLPDVLRAARGHLG